MNLLSLVIVLSVCSVISLEAKSADLKHCEKKIQSWTDLTENESLKKTAGLHYFEFKAPNGSNVYLVVADAREHDWLVKPVVNKPTATTTDTARRMQAIAASNGAFFNLSNGESTSYITVDGKQVCDPTQNEALTSNVKLKPFLKTIFERSELRILKDGNGKFSFAITAHNTAVDRNKTIVHAIQAGPRLLPTLTGEEEAFIRTEADGKVVDSIGVNKTAARTAIGITKNGKQLMLLCVAGNRQDEFSSGLTLAQLADLMRNLGCFEAINLDGGTSTTMAVKTKDDSIKMVCGRQPETLVKSAVVLSREFEAKK